MNEENEKLRLILDFLQRPIHAPNAADDDLVSAYQLAVIDAVKAVRQSAIGLARAKPERAAACGTPGGSA